ncbi:TMEM165/GDT1 family protein [Microseira sp. BLCC-F43]|uniref:TMEM165/GDT1 family protein n=1 Tax=Microseira sp. BLCC-F43 TaxID=3153602 RepID=UPI0035B7D2C6
MTVKLSSLPKSVANSGDQPLTETAPQDLKAANRQQEQPTTKLELGALAVFGSTFLTIFLSEMGDKTQVATLLMSAESDSPWMVFAGAGSALVATSLLGCLLGRLLAKWISPQVLNKAAGASMLLIAAQLLWEIVPR